MTSQPGSESADAARSDVLLVEHHDDRVVATLNRPDQRNAINKATIDALHLLCAQLEVVPKTLILTATGGNFAGGADIAELRARRAKEAKEGINLMAFRRIHALPMPVIAALDGYALGGGAELAYAADIRIASAGLVIGNPEPGLGIVAAAGATLRLPAIVGEARAAEMLLTGRLLNADEALACGLIIAIVDDPLAEAHAIADRIAKLEPRAVQHTKTLLRTPPADQPELIGELQAELFDSDAKMRRMTAFLERKTR